VENYDESREHKSYEDSNLDILDMTASTSEPIVEPINKELLIFRDFKWILRRSNALYNGDKNMSLRFPLLVFLLNKF
jgi:hypothetical protein